jgi:hypothetical protein
MYEEGVKFAEILDLVRTRPVCTSRILGNPLTAPADSDSLVSSDELYHSRCENVPSMHVQIASLYGFTVHSKYPKYTTVQKHVLRARFFLPRGAWFSKPRVYPGLFIAPALRGSRWKSARFFLKRPKLNKSSCPLLSRFSRPKARTNACFSGQYDQNCGLR